MIMTFLQNTTPKSADIESYKIEEKKKNKTKKINIVCVPFFRSHLFILYTVLHLGKFSAQIFCMFKRLDILC